MIALLSVALAFDPAALNERVEATQSLRTHRLAEIQPEIPASAYEKAAGGKIATGVEKVGDHPAKLGWGVGVFDAPIDKVWRALNDELNHGDLLPLSRVELVSGEPCTDGRKVLMVLPLPMISDRFWVNVNRFATTLAEKSDGKVRELSWSSVSDPKAEAVSAEGKAAVEGLVPTAFNKGAWFLVSLDAEHTLGEYHSWVDPGGNVPAGPASSFASSGIVDTFEAMETYANSGSIRCQ